MHGAQTDFVLSKSRYPAFVTGRGGGKTIAGVVKAFRYVFEHPGAVGVLTEPTYSKIDEILIPAIRSAYGHLEGKLWELKVGKYEIRFLGEYKDSVIYLRPGEEPEKIPGGNIAFFGLDEVKIGHQHETFMYLAPSLRQPGFPHQGWITTTPDWRRPWIRKRWGEHVNPLDERPLSPTQYKLFQSKTQDNWHNPEGYVEQLLEDYGESRFAEQELGGAFIIVEGAGFPMFKYDVHVREPPLDMEAVRTVAGLDFGITSPTSMHELVLDRSRKVWVTREFYQRDADEYDWVRTALNWGVKKIPCDPSISEKDLVELRRKHGLPLKRARSKLFDQRVKAISSRLTIREDGHPGMYISSSCPNLIQEIQNAAYDKPRGQEYMVDKWMTGVQDHALDDVGYGAMEFDGHIGQVTLPQFVRNLS